MCSYQAGPSPGVRCQSDIQICLKTQVLVWGLQETHFHSVWTVLLHEAETLARNHPDAVWILPLLLQKKHPGLEGVTGSIQVLQGILTLVNPAWFPARVSSAK